ncbi:MAG: hypothetical protein R2794_01100 [Chitinophagales bacterium]
MHFDQLDGGPQYGGPIHGKRMSILYTIEEKLLKVGILLQRGSLIKAQRLLEEVLEEEPDSAVAHYYLSEIYAHSANGLRPALYHITLAVKFDPHFADAWIQNLYIAYMLGEDTMLNDAANKALTLQIPYAFYIYRYLGMMYERQGAYVLAEENYKLAAAKGIQAFEMDLIKKCEERIKQKMKVRDNKSTRKTVALKSRKAGNKVRNK